MSARSSLELPSHSVLSQLARDDPGAYEALRQQLIADLIDGAPEELKPRLRGLQFRIDGIRQVSHSGLGSALRVYTLMWESFIRLNREMSEFRPAGPASPLPESAQVIAFRPRRPGDGPSGS